MEPEATSSAALQRENIVKYVQEVKRRIGSLLSSMDAQQLQEIVTVLLVSSCSSHLD